MRIAKYITVSIVCVCGAKLDAVLTDDKDLINDITVVVDNTHICPAAQLRMQPTSRQSISKDDLEDLENMPLDPDQGG